MRMIYHNTTVQGHCSLFNIYINYKLGEKCDYLLRLKLKVVLCSSSTVDPYLGQVLVNVIKD